jgi:hypothetical protein
VYRGLTINICMLWNDTFFSVKAAENESASLS